MKTRAPATTTRVPSGFLTLLIGLALVGVGVAMTIRAEIGVAPFDVLTTGLVEMTGIEIGLAAMLVPVVFIGLAALLGAKPGPGTVITVLLVGPILGVALRVLPELETLTPRVVLFLSGFALVTLGITAVVVADVGPGPSEILMLAVHRKGVALAPARTAIEVASVLIGWAMGGQVGAGTVIVAVLIGPALKQTLSAVGFDPLEADLASTIASPGA